MNTLDQMSLFCAERNGTFSRWMKREGDTLDDLIREQAEKIRRNREIAPLLSPEDFFIRVREHVAERLGEADARRAEQAARLGAVCTADHHGGLYCAQTFQGNLLFGEILKELGNRDDIIPIMPGGQVELDSSTFARGICTYSDREKKGRLPIFPEKPCARIACCTPAITPEQLARFRNRFVRTKQPGKLEETLDDLLRSVYETEEVLGSRRFEDQTTRIGAALSRKLFRDRGPLLVYMEMETLTLPLLIREIREGTSPLARMLLDPGVRRRMNEIPLPDGSFLSQFLFRTADAHGHKILLTLTGDGRLTGKDWHGDDVALDADPEALIDMLQTRKLIPGILTIAMMTFFERGITWLGGVFQTQYLPGWQQGLTALMKMTGQEDAAETIARFDCTGYVCGPMSALFQGNGFATCAGPVEFLMGRADYPSFVRALRSTGIPDAHRIGITEMFDDLAGRDDRWDGWYRSATEALDQRYPENVIAHG